MKSTCEIKQNFQKYFPCFIFLYSSMSLFSETCILFNAVFIFHVFTYASDS